MTKIYTDSRCNWTISRKKKPLRIPESTERTSGSDSPWAEKCWTLRLIAKYHYSCTFSSYHLLLYTGGSMTLGWTLILTSYGSSYNLILMHLLGSLQYNNFMSGLLHPNYSIFSKTSLQNLHLQNLSSVGYRSPTSSKSIIRVIWE